MIAHDFGPPMRNVSMVCPTHPVAADALATMRHKDTPPPEFGRQMHRLSLVLATQATRSLQTTHVLVPTPLANCDCTVLNERVALVPIMRAGDGMLDAFKLYVPDAIVWHMSIAREEETAVPVFKDSKVPAVITNIDTIFVLDPMLATGGSASFALMHLRKRGAKGKLVFVGVIGCPEGVSRLNSEHPDVEILLGDIDPILNDKFYIEPGLGDAGDRLHPTIPWPEASFAQRLRQSA